MVTTRLWVGLVTAALVGCSSGDNDDAGNGTGSSGEPGACNTELAFCPGAAAPEWSVPDFQPKSPRFEERYGLQDFRGNVVLVAFFSSWCPYCQAQTAQLEKLRAELAEEGVTDVKLLVVNSTDAVSTQAELVSRTELPLFQDDDAEVVFAKHRARKDDLALYDREGTLRAFYDHDVERDLREDGTYAAIKAALLDAR